MAIVHDLAESLAGDITPHAGVSKEEKYRLEQVRAGRAGARWRAAPAAATRGGSRLDAGLVCWRLGLPQEALAMLMSHLGSTPAAAAEISALWEEYEKAETPEALLVKDLDKFEMIVQALEYEEGALGWAARPPPSAGARAATNPRAASGVAREVRAADSKRLDGFFKSTEGKFVHPQVRAWAEALYARRKALHARRGWTDDAGAAPPS